jgi:hypothetical protein
MSRVLRRITDVGRDLYGRNAFGSFAASDGEGASFVRASDAASPFSAVEASALGRAGGLITEFGVANLRLLDGEKQLDGDAVRDELVVRE